MMVAAKMKMAAMVWVVAASMLVICTVGIAAERPGASVQPPATMMAGAVGRADWRSRFDAVYRLEEGQVLKYVATPFIPERMEWYRSENAGQAEALPEGPEVLGFSWDGKTAKPRSMSFGTRSCRLDWIVSSFLEIPKSRLDGPEELMGIEIPHGDFIVRTGTTEAQRLAALQELIRQHTGRDIRFELQKLDREVIVARGRYSFHPLPDSISGSAIELYSDPAENKDPSGAGGGGSGDLSELLAWMGSSIGRNVIDGTEGPRPVQQLSWRTFHSSYLSGSSEGKERNAKTDVLLSLVAQQTGLVFTRESRKVSMWVVSESR